MLARDYLSVAGKEVSEERRPEFVQACLIDREGLISDLVPFSRLSFCRYKRRIWCPGLASTPDLAFRNSSFRWPDFYNPFEFTKIAHRSHAGAGACELLLTWKKGQCGEIVMSAQSRNERSAEVPPEARL